MARSNLVRGRNALAPFASALISMSTTVLRAVWAAFASTQKPTRFCATTGFGMGLLGYIFERYCGRTPIRSPYVASRCCMCRCALTRFCAFLCVAVCSKQLFDVFRYMKLYTPAGVSYARNFDRVWHRIEWLASVLNEIHPVRDADERGAWLPADFFSGTIGSVDTVPITIRKAVDRSMNRATYSGKYKRCVVKFQVRALRDVHDSHPLTAHKCATSLFYRHRCNRF
jgi:hypothetical protein